MKIPDNTLAKKDEDMGKKKTLVFDLDETLLKVLSLKNGKYEKLKANSRIFKGKNGIKTFILKGS